MAGRVARITDTLQWSPADTRCVAGELLMEGPSGETWELSGKVVALARAGAESG